MNTTRIALVTGANQGVGRQVARELAAHGLTVFIGRVTWRVAKKQPAPSAPGPRRFSST